MSFDAFIVGGMRTPVGKYGGALAHVRLDDLLGQTMVAACQSVGVPLERIEERLELPARPKEFAVRRGGDAEAPRHREACPRQFAQVRTLPAHLG